MNTIHLRTQKHTQFVEITRNIQDIVSREGVKNGLCTIFVPHTTAGVTINEHADPDVIDDIVGALEKMVPWEAGYSHSEGNSAAHIKASLIGFSQNVIVENGKLQLGTWQGIFFAEFDGPRTRTIWVTVKA
ncbi:MAG: secondary thiamine-phosphate synthase enzyme YjbQ [Endomicrobiales bacterium]